MEISHSLLARITLNPEVCFGKPTIRNLRYPVEVLLDLLSTGATSEEVLAGFPDLEAADLRACLLYAAQLVRVKTIYPAVSHC